jgi:ubiquinone/menaquinone biosynthesis C-methylase UbiE
LGEEQYFRLKQDDEELERLRIQANIYDPVTIRGLERLCVRQGWKCLEVGAGPGTIVEWLSSEVGDSGKIVATDIDVKFLNRLSAPNLEIRRHDVLKDDLEEGLYDLVHSRKLLHHFSEPEKAVKRMAAAVRPGGWLLLEEDDHGSVLSVDVTNPSATSFRTIYGAVVDYYRKKGIVDFYFGRRVRGLVEQLGFIDVGQEGWTSMLRGGDPMADLYAAMRARGAIEVPGISRRR